MAEHQTFKKLSNLEIAAFCSQMAMVLQAGISSLEGIAILREEAESREDEKILTVIYDTLSDTGQLSSALEAPAYFRRIFCECAGSENSPDSWTRSCTLWLPSMSGRQALQNPSEMPSPTPWSCF